MTTNIDLIRLAKDNNIKLDYILYKDELVKIKYKPGLNIILNMSSSNHPGTHWIAIHTLKDKIIYFDSFGQVPPIEVENWGKKNITYNNYQIEKLDGENCGQLCLLFLKLVN